MTSVAGPTLTTKFFDEENGIITQIQSEPGKD